MAILLHLRLSIFLSVCFLCACTLQFGGSDPAMLLAAAQLVATHCDAVELNCGCPQRCAKQGGYGAFLMEQPELLESLVRALAQDDSSSTCTDSSSSNSHSNSTSSNSSNNSSSSGGGGIRRPDGTRLPVFVKVRVFDDVAATIALCLRVEAAGADALTVHGRTRHQVFKSWQLGVLFVDQNTSTWFIIFFSPFLKRPAKKKCRDNSTKRKPVA